jgi:uncharacterized repeat protein (TIGR01451 family)
MGGTCLSVTKTSTATASTRTGDTVTYTVTATNTGDQDYTTANPAEVDDNLSGVLDDATYSNDATATIGTTNADAGLGYASPTLTWKGALAAGATVTLTYTVTITGNGDGSVDNLAWAPLTPTPAGVTPTPPACDPPTAGGTDPTTGEPCAPSSFQLQAGISIVKHAGAPVDVNGDGTADIGDTIRYTFTVTNTGSVPLTDPTVTDAKAGAVTCPTNPLRTGASETCTADALYTITAADMTAGAVNNTATAQGTPPGSTTPITSTPSTTTTPVVAPAPSLSLVKSADPSGTATFTPGQTITYNFVVTNTGNIPLNDITIDEGTFSGTGTLSPAICPDSTLAVGDQEVCTATYTLTAADVNSGSVTNTATADGTPPGSTTPIPSNPSTVAIPTPPQPAITMVKTATPTTVTNAGQTVNYSFLVTNTGNVTMSNVTINEGNFSGTGTISAVDCPESTLVAGQFETCTATYTVTQADVDAGTVTNTATADGTPPGTTTPVPSTPSTSTVTIPATPGITVKKTTDVAAAAVGEKVTYSFLVTNTGNVTETDPAVTDSNFSGTGTLSAIVCLTGPVILAPGDSETCTATYTVTQADVDSGSLTNTATATATPPTGDTPPTSPPSTVNVPTNPHPALSVVKTADKTTLTSVGQVVTYTFDVTNTGNVNIDTPTVHDSKFSGTGQLSAINCPTDASAGSLAPGVSENCTATYTVTEADLVSGKLSNTATVTGTTPGGDPVGSTPSTVTVKTVVPAAAAALAFTGSDVFGPLIGGAGLVFAGMIALLVMAIIRRRGNRTTSPDQP